MKDPRIIHALLRFQVRYNGVNGGDLTVPRESEVTREAGLLMLLPDTNIDRIATILKKEFVGKTVQYSEWVPSRRKYESQVKSDKNAFIIGENVEHKPEWVYTTCVIEAVNIVSIKRVDMDVQLGFLVAEK